MRAPREESSSSIYHIVARGSGRQLIFEDDCDREDFLTILGRTSMKYGIEILGWCLMGNHVHLLLMAPIDEISKAMQVLLCTYALHFNEKAGRCGHLFQERFKSEPIEDDEYLLCALRYIHFNPEKAHVAAHDCYEWSSYGEYIGKPRLCSTDYILSFFETIRDFIMFHRIESNERHYLDVPDGRRTTRSMPDAEAIRIAESVLDGVPLTDLKAMDKSQRNHYINMLLDSHLSVRQIERLTGIGRGIIDYVKTCQ